MKQIRINSKFPGIKGLYNEFLNLVKQLVHIDDAALKTEIPSVEAGSNITVVKDGVVYRVSADASAAGLLPAGGSINQLLKKASGADYDAAWANETGEANTASNLGAGEGVYASKSGVDLRFKSLVAGTNISITSDGNEITISGAGAGPSLLQMVAGNESGVVLTPLSNFSLTHTMV